MLNLVPIKCPQCGADLSIEEGRETAFCSYCGAKIVINDENRFTFRHIDEAQVKHAETERMVKMKQMEMAEKSRDDSLKTRSLKIKASIALGVIGVVMMIVGSTSTNLSMLSLLGFFPLMAVAWMWLDEMKGGGGVDSYGNIRVPSSISDYTKKNYASVEATLKSAGFTNIQCIPLNNLSVGLLKKPGMVESITISGESVTTGGKKYPQDAPIIISYHSINK